LAVDVTADRTLYNVPQSDHTQPAWVYSLIYSFQLKFAFDACQLCSQPLCFWLNDASYSKGDGKMYSPARNRTVKLPTPYTDPECHAAKHHRQTDRQMDQIIMPRADHTGYSTIS